MLPVLLTLAVVAIVAGSAVASITIQRHGSTRSNGQYVSASDLSWWILSSVAYSILPATVPGPASTTVGAPTVLPAAATSYGANPLAGGDPAVLWTFTESVSAPISKEFEIKVTVGIDPSTTVIKVYLETQASAIGGPIVFSFYWDSAAFGGGLSGFTNAISSETVQQCAAIGTCP